MRQTKINPNSSVPCVVTHNSFLVALALKLRTLILFNVFMAIIHLSAAMCKLAAGCKIWGFLNLK